MGSADTTYSNIADLIRAYICSVILIVGICNNTLALLLLNRLRTCKKLNIFYFKCMTLFDLTTLSIGLTPSVIESVYAEIHWSSSTAGHTVFTASPFLLSSSSTYMSAGNSSSLRTSPSHLTPPSPDNTGRMKLANLSWIICRFQNLLAFICGDLAIWSLVLVTVSRMFIVARPMQVKSYDKRRRAILNMAVLIGAALIKNLFLAFTFEYKLVAASGAATVSAGLVQQFDNTSEMIRHRQHVVASPPRHICDVNKHMNIFYHSVSPWLSLTFYYVIPTSIVIYCTLIIYQHMDDRITNVQQIYGCNHHEVSVAASRDVLHSVCDHLSTKKRKECNKQIITDVLIWIFFGYRANHHSQHAKQYQTVLSQTRIETSQNSTFSLPKKYAGKSQLSTSPQSGSASPRPGNRNTTRTTVSSNRMLIRITLWISVLYVVMVTPSFIIWTYHRVADQHSYVSKGLIDLLFAITDVLIFTHHSMNFFIYMLTSSVFRHEFLHLIRLSRRHSKKLPKSELQPYPPTPRLTHTRQQCNHTFID